VDSLILARHGESVFSARLLVNGDASVPGPLTPRGVAEAESLGRALLDEPVGLCVTTGFGRTQQTADVALAGRRLVVRELDDPRYGSFEGGALEDYRAWASGASSADEAPGGGESRRSIVARYARGFRLVLARSEARVLGVLHSLPIAYVLAARDGDPPGRRPALVEHARPYTLSAGDLDRAVGVLEDWCASPTW
jgi:broad specificity phosphatase PhoE